MRFSILVTAAPHYAGAVTAYQFSKAVLNSGNHITRIFFYSDGVYNSNAFTTLPQDEFNLVHAWQQLAQEHNLELIVCVSAALRRGIIDQTEAARYDKNAANLAEGFKISGLGQLIEAMIQADRFISFH